MKRSRIASVLLAFGILYLLLTYVDIIRNIIFNTSGSTNNQLHNGKKYLQDNDILHIVNNRLIQQIQAKQIGNTENIPSIGTKTTNLQEINNRNSDNLQAAKPTRSSTLHVMDNVSNVAPPAKEGTKAKFKCETRSLFKVMRPYKIRKRPPEVTSQTAHPECDRKLEYMNPPGPVTALASFPGAGNTWTRHMIQQLTGQLVPIEGV